MTLVLFYYVKCVELNGIRDEFFACMIVSGEWNSTSLWKDHDKDIEYEGTVGPTSDIVGMESRPDPVPDVSLTGIGTLDLLPDMILTRKGTGPLFSTRIGACTVVIGIGNFKI
jgi:hypothetical protein